MQIEIHFTAKTLKICLKCRIKNEKRKNLGILSSSSNPNNILFPASVLIDLNGDNL